MFLGFFKENFLQENVCPYAGRCHEGVFKKFTITGHGNSPPMYGTRDCRDGDKVLCNRCPLKHEVRERGRGEIIYENVPN